MTTPQRMKSSMRAVLAKPIVVLLTLYVATLTISMFAMEIAAWTMALFFVIFLLVDRTHQKPQLEFHTLGVEFPLLVFAAVVILGLRLNAPQGDFLAAMGALRNLVLLFVLAYALQLVQNLNRLIFLLVICGTAIAGYEIWQHYTGLVFWFQDNGLLIRPLLFSHAIVMTMCIPWAAFLLSRNARWWQILSYLISFGVIFTGLAFTYGRGTWIAVLVSLLAMAFFTSKKFFLVTLSFLVIGGGLLLKISPEFRDKVALVFSENDEGGEERRRLWQINMEMFHDHPWIGVGYLQNEPLSQTYYEKLGITDGKPGHASSNYVELLSTTGILGFTSYMLFILGFVLLTARLYSTIPSTHYWHRVFALSALGAQLAFHVGGLTQWNFGETEVQHQFLFWLAIVAYMSQRYYAHVVPDDRSL